MIFDPTKKLFLPKLSNIYPKLAKKEIELKPKICRILADSYSCYMNWKKKSNFINNQIVFISIEPKKTSLKETNMNKLLCKETWLVTIKTWLVTITIVYLFIYLCHSTLA